MNCAILSWNTRGLGRPEKRRSVVKTINSCGAKVVFLQETKVSGSKMDTIRRMCGQRKDGCSISPATGASGGLMSLWEKGFFSLESQISYDRVIVLIGTFSSNNERCGLVNVYAPNDPVERGCFFESLSNILVSAQVPVIVGGDFNVVKCREEKVGAAVDDRAMGKFNEFIQCNGLVDLPMGGNFFTWSRREPHVTACVLDRFLVSPEVISWFPKLSQSALQRKLSDHCPVLLREEQIIRRHGPFKWFTHWGENPKYCESMQSVLTSKRSRGIGAKLREAKRATKAWVTAENLKDGESVENLEKRISSIDKELLRVQSGSREESALKVEAQNLNTKLWNRYRRDEREWLQKSRVRWFKEGDKNTRFFHLSASLRSNMNFIRCITVGNHIIRDQVEISKAFEEHFNVSFNDSKTIPVKNFPGEFNQLSQESGVADSLNKIMANFLWGSDSRRAIHWVKWEHVCRPKDHGGLGIFNVLLRNRSLLNKRIWRFGSEHGAFWRNVIDAKYGFDSLSLMPKQLSDRKASWLWRGIAKPLSNSNDLFSSGIRFKLGDGSRIEFWEDFWTEVRTLKEAFPRIFNLSVKKSGKVGQFGHKESDKWVWSIATRRELFDWERRMWEEFMNVIERAASNTGRGDKLVWINALAVSWAKHQ
ncbi:hypothetical protein GQ457_01G003850 [Hibiscus cannabinus]